jgi:transposase
MWQHYLHVIHAKCSQALHILDRFYVVAKINTAWETAETRRMARDGREPLLKSRSFVLKRKENLHSQQKFGLRDLLRYNLQIVRAYNLPHWPARSWTSGASEPYAAASS